MGEQVTVYWKILIHGAVVSAGSPRSTEGNMVSILVLDVPFYITWFTRIVLRKR